MSKKKKSFIEKNLQTLLNIREKVKQLRKEKKSSKKNNVKNPFKEDKVEHRLVELSVPSIAKSTAMILILLLLAVFVYEIRGVLVVFFVAWLFAAALDPTVDYFEEKKVPRWLSLVGIYIFMFGFIAFFFSQVIPLVTSQILELSSRIGDLVENLNLDNTPVLKKIAPFINDLWEAVDRQTIIDTVKTGLEKIGNQLQDLAGNAVAAIVYVSNGVFNIIMILILTFFMTVEETGINNFIISLFPHKYSAYILDRTNSIKRKTGHWLRGQLGLMLIVGVISYIGFLIIGVEYALTLALIAGMLELIPYLGPILTWLVAAPIAANQSMWMILWVTIVLVVVQQLENNVLVPLIMRKAVGLSPIITIFALLVGFQFLGILGIIISVPVATIVAMFVSDYAAKEK